MHRLAAVFSVACLFPLLGASQSARAGSATVRMVVSVGHLYGGQPPLLTRDDLTVTQQIDSLPVVNVIPLRGERAALDLFVLVDHCSDCDPGSKVEELRHFISSQPPSTAVGVAYIQNAVLHVAEMPTTDHARAMKALGAPQGSTPGSPFRALKELIQKWPQGSPRRAVLMISNGMDPDVPDSTPDPNADAAIEAAQRAGVAVYAIYHPSADYMARDFSKLYWGQIQLAHVANETGGEAYFTTFGPLPSLAPFLADIATHLANQYLVEFLATPPSGPGALRDFTVKSRIPDIDLIAPYKAWVPGSSKEIRP